MIYLKDIVIKESNNKKKLAKTIVQIKQMRIYSLFDPELKIYL